MSAHTQSRRVRRGFTLIEVVVTVSVVAIVAAIGISTIQTSQAQAAQGSVVQEAKDDLLEVRDAAVSNIQCRRVNQLSGSASNKSLRVYHDTNCTPDSFGDDVLLQTIDYDPALVTRVKVEDNGIFDDENIQYRTDGALFDTETTRVIVTTVDLVQHHLNIQLATGSVVLE
jgi:prepilin-type N-terminal cleavage/methylation domain-containing protein